MSIKIESMIGVAVLSKAGRHGQAIILYLLFNSIIKNCTANVFIYYKVHIITHIFII